jgi:hypothetical protein
MRARTLNRRLNDVGTGFQELVEEGRFKIVREMLEGSAMGIGELASSLDYADAAPS